MLPLYRLALIFLPLFDKKNILPMFYAYEFVAFDSFFPI